MLEVLNIITLPVLGVFVGSALCLCLCILLLLLYVNNNF